MPQFCEVALPVPLETTLTYQVDGDLPVVGGRVLVPFRDRRLPGIVTALHRQPPAGTVRLVLRVLDKVPLIDEDLLKLARWLAQYYLAPLGEVLRTMLPLTAEWKRARGYRITEAGQEAWQTASRIGRSRRLPLATQGKIEKAETDEYEVLHYLEQHGGEAVREATLRSASGASRELLTSLLRRKWIAREDLSETRDATRTVKIAVLQTDGEENPTLSRPSNGAIGMVRPDHGEDHDNKERSGRALNTNQRHVLDALAAAGGRLALDSLRGLPVPRTTWQTLVKRGLVGIVEEPAAFELSRVRVRRPLDFAPTEAQRNALERIQAAGEARRFSVSLLHGVTGSGKTAVYLAAMQKVLAEGRSAIMLVPEIGLTPAAAAQLHQAFGSEVAILHSGLTGAERAEQWHRIHRGEARIVVGTRSAVFAPVSDLALVVVDEEHDNSYKQEETPRYHARDVAVVRARLAQAAVVLGSATPSLESYYNARNGKYELIEMPDRVEQRPLPEVELVDMREEFQQTGQRDVISSRLAEEIAVRLERGEQAMVLLNRRGFSAFVMCRACGETVQCRNCAIAMTYHKRLRRPAGAPLDNDEAVGEGGLECHYCGYRQKAPSACPKCGSDYVQFLGTGSEKLEELLHSRFPQARIGRLDRDTVRGRHDIERVLNAMEAGEMDLLVGTQMIAKGHDLHGVTLVGVVGADAALSCPISAPPSAPSSC